MEYVISGKQFFVCLDAEDNIYISRVTMKAFKSNNYMELARIYDILQNNPAMACKDEWGLETWDSALNRLVRYRMKRDAEKKAQKETFPIEVDSDSQRQKRIRFSKSMRKKVYEAYNGKCAICGRTLQIEHSGDDDYITIDHITPLHKGGKNEIVNYQATCRCCNQIKMDTMPDVFKNQFKSTMAEEVLSNPEYQNMLLRKIYKNKILRCMAGIKAALL